MKPLFRGMGPLTALAFLAVAGVLAYIRLAPSDAALWHIDPTTSTDATPPPCEITRSVDRARAACLFPEAAPAALLTRLDAIALATPRTRRLAGSAAEGRITWVTRSRLMGFPDYTTAQATQTPQGTRLDLFARLRFGGADNGVNAARLDTWLPQL